MSKPTLKSGVDRILDANLNRAQEGLRVCEEISRFILENKQTAARLKTIRHAINTLSEGQLEKKELLEKRNSQRDIGKNIYINELNRRDISDIAFANLSRVKESLRVLEEFSKLKKPSLAVRFKHLRYQTYEIEKKFIKEVTALRHSG